MVLHYDTRGVTGFHIRKANWQLNKRAQRTYSTNI